MSKRLIIFLTIIGLLGVTGTALAVEDEEREDTTFSYGYDDIAGILLWNIAPRDGLYDCTLENGALGTTYTLRADGVVEVSSLTSGGSAVMFDPTPEGDLEDGLPPASDSAPYTGADGVCGVSGGEVAGPNGQINHGMFMKLFNSMFDGNARGCVNRFLARSDLGKGDQKVRVSDVDDAAPALADGDEGDVTFTTVLADCERGKADKAGKADKVTGKDKAAEKQAQKADRQRGKSGSAPGQNK